MVYIEAILSLCNKHHSFRIDADDMKELMDKAVKIIHKAVPKCGVFELVLFNSNTISANNFIKLIEDYLK